MFRAMVAATTLVATVVISAQISLSEAFLAPPVSHVSDGTRRASTGKASLLVPTSRGSFSLAPPTTILNMAKKKRRRRKDALPKAEPAPGEAAEPVPSLDDGELPDFDLDEEAELTEKTAPAATSAASTSIPPPTNVAPMNSMESVDMTDPKVKEAMRGSKSGRAPATSMDDLLRDRTLEKSFTFDDAAAKEDLPSLGELAGKGRSRSSTDVGERGSFIVEEKMGKKRARAEARRAAAQEAEKAEEEGKGLLKSVPFILGENGEVSVTKVLEAGAWAGIAILVLWEVYLNSPFFERAAPMVPVVYEFLI